MLRTAALLVLTALASCAPRSRMCTATQECALGLACVAGRCQLDGPRVRAAVDAARRVVVRPEALAYVTAGGAESSRAHVRLGASRAALLMRFPLEVPSGVNVVEAYVVLHRSDGVDDDPIPVLLHGRRIIERWDPRSTSWARLPRTNEAPRCPASVVTPGGPTLVRVDVRDLVRRWTRRDPDDRGIALVGSAQAGVGMSFALSSAAGASGPSEKSAADRARTGSAPDLGPYLEVYLR